MSAARVLPIASPEITFEVVTITPILAEKWLGKNVANRNVSQNQVKSLARSMVDGEWMLNGESIKFAQNGDLLDGQHRLLAVMLSGKTVPILVVRGLPTETQDLMDTGRARTAANMLQIKGYPNANNLAASARIVLLHEGGDRTALASRKISNRRIDEFVKDNALLAYASSRGSTISRTFRLRPSTIGACFYLLTQVDEEQTETFFDRCGDGVGLPKGSPILALRDRAAKNREDRLHSPYEAEISMVFRAWNAWRTGRKLSTIRAYMNGELIPCPVPK